MKSKRLVSGTMTSGDTPDWTELADLIQTEMLGWFMWMFAVELEDGARIEAYKHRISRRYLHLAHDGRAFYFAGNHSYREVDRHDAFVAVFNGPGPACPCEPTLDWRQRD
jgi:hypothetical protein